MAAIRKFSLQWNTVSGCIRALAALGPGYLKREEPVRLLVKVDAEIEDALDLKFTFKPLGEFDGTPLLKITGWTWDADALTWTKDITVSSAPIDTLLGVNADTSDDVDDKPCSLDLCALGTADAVLVVSDTLKNVLLKNNDGRSDDPAPQSGTGEREFYAGVVTGYADGSWAADIVTAGRTFGLYKFTDEDGVLRQFILKTSASATTLPGIVRPPDYHASTNARAWFQVA